MGNWVKGCFRSAHNNLILLYLSILAFNLDYYSEVQDLSYLLDHLSDNPFLKKYKCLNESLISVVEDYSLVSLVPLNVQVMKQYISQ